MTTALLHERFFDVASRFPDRPFVGTPPNIARRWVPEGLVHTYSAAAKRIGEIAQIYKEAGVGHGHRVGSDIENHPDYFLHKLALATLGASIVPLNPDMKTPELVWALTLTRPTHVVTFPWLRAGLEEAIKELETPPHLVDFADFDQGLPGVKFEAPESGAIDDNTETLILFTSGTTGRSKGCRYSHDYEIALGDWYSSLGGLAAFRPGQECVYNPLPVYHSDCGIRAFHEMLPQGGALFTSDRFRPTTFWDDCRVSHTTVIHYLGIVSNLLLAQPESARDRQHEVRMGIGAGAGKESHVRFEERFGFPLIEVWGMTECMRMLADCREPRTIGERAVGRPRAGLDVRVVDDDDNEVAPGEQGELTIRHSAATPRKGLFSGYIGDPEATSFAWRGGWFHTGDTVTKDATELVRFVDRKKNIIRRAGENIAAVEVEAALSTHPLVAQVAVISVPDELREEEVFACIVPSAKAMKTPQKMADMLFEHCRSRLAYFKIPGWFLFVDDLPKTPSQKMQKFAIFPKDVDPRAASGVLDLRGLKKRS